MMNRAFSAVLTTLLVVSIFMMGMFYSFTAGEIRLTQSCDFLNGFYSQGRIYICIPSKKGTVIVNPITESYPRPQIY